METNLTFQKYIYSWVTKIGILKEKKVRTFACLRDTLQFAVFLWRKEICGIVVK